MLAARRKMRPCLLAFLTAAMLGRYLGVFLEPDLSMVLPTVLPKLGDLDSSGAESSGTLCSHCRAKSIGLGSRGLALSVEAVLSIDRVLASWSGLRVTASALLFLTFSAPGASVDAVKIELDMALPLACHGVGLPSAKRTTQQHSSDSFCKQVHLHMGKPHRNMRASALDKPHGVPLLASLVPELWI